MRKALKIIFFIIPLIVASILLYTLYFNINNIPEYPIFTFRIVHNGELTIEDYTDDIKVFNRGGYLEDIFYIESITKQKDSQYGSNTFEIKSTAISYIKNNSMDFYNKNSFRVLPEFVDGGWDYIYNHPLYKKNKYKSLAIQILNKNYETLGENYNELLPLDHYQDFSLETPYIDKESYSQELLDGKVVISAEMVDRWNDIDNFNNADSVCVAYRAYNDGMDRNLQTCLATSLGKFKKCIFNDTRNSLHYNIVLQYGSVPEYMNFTLVTFDTTPLIISDKKLTCSFDTNGLNKGETYVFVMRLQKYIGNNLYEIIIVSPDTKIQI